MNWDPQADLSWGAKQLVLAEYFNRYPRSAVVETGCWNGQGSCLQFAAHSTVYVIETNPGYCEMARAHDWTVIEGDSADELPRLLGRIDVPAFFWLDAHLVAESNEPNHSPLMDELHAILNWEHGGDSVILIDDIRMMGRDGWPTLGEVEEMVAGAGRWRIEVRDDIVRLTP